MINIDEVFVANGIAILMMIFLLDCRQKNRESLHTDDKIYDGMAVTTLLGALFETIYESDALNKYKDKFEAYKPSYAGDTGYTGPTEPSPGGGGGAESGGSADCGACHGVCVVVAGSCRAISPLQNACSRAVSPAASIASPPCSSRPSALW